MWTTIREAREYGNDVADWMCKLEMEFFRFQTWWTALEHLALTHRKPQSQLQVRKQDSPLQSVLSTSIRQPIIAAAENVLRLLSEIEEVLQQNGVLPLKTKSAQQAALQTGKILDLNTEVEALKARRNKFSTDLMKHTSWYKRLTHGTSPWKPEPDKKVLNGKLESIIYWNEALYSILPQATRDSILQLGIAGYALDASDNAPEISRLSGDRDALLKESANLLITRQRFSIEARGKSRQTPSLTMRRESSCLTGFDPMQITKGSRYSMVGYQQVENGTMTETRALVEWFPFPRGEDAYSLRSLARQRMNQLSFILQSSQKPATLHTLHSLGFTELSSGSVQHFGLISELPAGTKTSAKPVTLHDLLARKPASRDSRKATKQLQPLPATAEPHSLPTLRQRIDLATTLASSFYTFMLTRWHHERFSSLNIAFLIDPSSSAKLNSSTIPLPPDLSAPIIGGFAISRPESTSERSIFMNPSSAEELYLHPEIRSALSRYKANSVSNAAQGTTHTVGNNAPQEPQLPRFQRIYDIYAFGILLAELGFWIPVSQLVERETGTKPASSVPIEHFKNALVRKCRTDLACWTGDTYRDVTIGCLMAGDSEGIDAEDLNSFYWDVVVRLIGCIDGK